MILRPDYINAITPFIDVPLVKILSGVRRSGKSTILEMMKLELQKRFRKKPAQPSLQNLSRISAS